MNWKPLISKGTKKADTCITTYPTGAASRNINCNLSRAKISSRRPTYNHVIALVGRIAQANAAKAKPNFLETEGNLLEETLKVGQ